MSQDKLAEVSGVSKGDISRHERNDHKSNPSVDALLRIAAALQVSVSALFEPVGKSIPRPEEKTGHAEDRRAAVSGHPGLEELLVALDDEFPAEDSVEGDIHKAIAALNRALRRGRTATAPGGQAAKAGR